jgi:hypothetical protein
LRYNKVLIILAVILTLLGTFVFSIKGVPGTYACSGIGYITNLPIIFEVAESVAISKGWNVILWYLLLIIFIIFLISGVFQLIGLKYRILALIFSLFPLIVGIMLIIIFFAPPYGDMAQTFLYYSYGEYFGNFFPFIVIIGEVGLGAYILVAGGVLGLISVFLPRDTT